MLFLPIKGVFSIMLTYFVLLHGSEARDLFQHLELARKKVFFKSFKSLQPFPCNGDALGSKFTPQNVFFYPTLGRPGISS
jgi:hypothetical protein